jgi:hypothetical protein
MPLSLRLVVVSAMGGADADAAVCTVWAGAGTTAALLPCCCGSMAQALIRANVDASAMREVCGKQRDKLCRMKSVTKVLH